MKVIKLFFAIIILSLSLQITNAQAGISKELNLRYMMSHTFPNYLTAFGKVKTIRLENYSLKIVNGKWVEGEKYLHTVINYDPIKSKIEVVLLRGKQRIFRKEVYSMNSEGKLINWDLYEADGRHSGTKANFKYNKDGQISEVVNDLLGSFSYRETFSYPNKNRVQVVRQFSYNPNEQTKEIYVYDNAENVKEVIFPNGDGKVKETITFDKNGNPITFSVYGKSAKLLEKNSYKYEFDKNGNWVKTILLRYDADKPKGQRKSLRVTKRIITYY